MISWQQLTAGCAQEVHVLEVTCLLIPIHAVACSRCLVIGAACCLEGQLHDLWGHVALRDTSTNKKHTHLFVVAYIM